MNARARAVLQTTSLLVILTASALATQPASMAPPGPPSLAPATTASGPIAPAVASPPKGYYRHPALFENTIVFAAEGDLWKVPVAGGVATRITSHPGDESQPAISPDGKHLAFLAQYEGPTEVYSMPLAGGLPTRLTFDAARCSVSGWTADGKVIASTDRLSTLPNGQLTILDPAGKSARRVLPLAQATDGCFDGPGTKGTDGTLFFTRLNFQGSATKRYKGGTIQQLWRFAPGDAEATPLTADFAGTSKRPMFWQGRVYFLSDRDGTMNIWSMLPDGKDLKPHTTHKGFDAQGGTLHNGRIVYQLGADIYLLDLASGTTRAIDITLDSDLDQMRERWIEKPLDYLTSAHVSPEGDKIVVVARGHVFVIPHRQGRIVDVTREDSGGVRYREARFTTNPDGSESIIALSDKSGEIELWRLDPAGLAAPVQLTTDARVLRWDALPSPDGKLIAHHDKDQQLWVYDVAKNASTLIDTTQVETFDGLTWSPDSRFLAYSTQADNMFRVVRLWSADSGKVSPVTSDRFDSYSPAWHTDSAGASWLFFLSDRTFRTLVASPWGPNQPDPFLDETTKIFALALKPNQRWPFAPRDEVQDKKDKDKKNDEKPASDKKDEAKKDEPAKDEKKDEPKKDDAKSKKPAPKPIEIVLDGLAERLYEVPIPAGNYINLSATEKALFYLSSPSEFDRKNDLKAVEIKNDGTGIEAKTVLADIAFYEIAAGGTGKKMLVRKKDTFFIIDAAASPASDIEKKAVNFAGWSLSITPRRQWRQMFIDSWRLMRDYFYDPAMHGVNWRAMLDKYLPLVDRVTNRAELNDLMVQMMGELSALHHFVRGGDLRDSPDNIPVAALGAELVRDDATGGFRIARIYRAEPDEPAKTSPLARPEVAAQVGDIITMIDGTPTLSVPDCGALLRRKADRQVLIRIKSSTGTERDAILTPISTGAESDLRYTDWEYSRRLEVDKLGDNKIGYLHLRAMGGGDYAHWVKGFYPVFNRDALIIDVRHNRGGNIDSWILGKLLRKAWFAWSQRVGNPPSWNMQYAFRGHVVVLCNERTASDGEAFAEGFRRLGLGKIIGTRTWGGEIWLSSSNVLVDKGIASAAETGVWGPEGVWLIEGHGVDPDIVIDNPPHATFKGEDTQLKAAVDHLLAKLRESPVPPLNAPKKPDKSFENK